LLPKRCKVAKASTIRCFSGTDGGGDGGSKNSKSKTRRGDGSPHIGGAKPKGKKYDAWTDHQHAHSQRVQRRPSRFGPKSQKYFQASMGPAKHYGIRMLNLKLVKDSSQVPILIPGKALKDREDGNETSDNTANTSNNKSNSENEGKSSSQKQQAIKDASPLQKDDSTAQRPNRPRRRRRMLPIVNAAALLDTTNYCKRSAFPGGVVSRSGTEAAKRLLRGKKDLIDMLRGHIILQQSQRPFCLAGHGVPKQLLQDHINMGDSILSHFNEPAEISLSNMDEYSDPLSPDCMRIRDQDGQSRMWAWPPQPQFQAPKEGDDEEAQHRLEDISQKWSHSFTLYLSVMDRIANKLGLVGSYLHKDTRKEWKVKMFRGMAYPLEVISRPDDEDIGAPVPILEWAPGNRISDKQPHVSIRLQGMSDLDLGSSDGTMGEPGGVHPVTLVFDACFQEDPRLEPAEA